MTRVEVDLRTDGLLWLINRTVFHPRGYALALDTTDGRFFLCGDGTEPWTFGDATETGPHRRVKELMP